MSTEEKNNAIVERLKRSRAYRGHVTRNINKAFEIMNNEEPSLADIESYVEIIDTKIEAIRVLDKEIAEHLDGKDLDNEIEESLDYSAEVITGKSQLVRFIKMKIEVVIVPIIPPAPIDFGRDVYTQLPKITLNEFSGKLLEWASFWDSFEAAIHRNPRITDVDKMNYLRGLLKGEALRVINGLSLTNCCYEVAVTLLKEQFGDKQMLINSFMEALLKLQSTTCDIKKLRYFYDVTEGYI